MTERMALGGTRLGVFGKGGSGKSTLTVLLARALQERGYDVCVVDADSTNEGMEQALGVTSSPRSLVDYFGGMVFSGGRVTCPVDDPTPLPGAEVGPATLPPEYWGVSPEGICLLSVGKMGDYGVGAGCDGPIAKIARDLRVRAAGHPVTVLDFKAGIEDVARGVVTGLDWIVVTVDSTTAAVHMAVHMRDMVQDLARGAAPATAHLESQDLVRVAEEIFRKSHAKGPFVVLSRVPNEQTDSYLRDRLRVEGIAPIGSVRENDTIRDSWLYGTPLDSTESRAEVTGILHRLEVAAAALIDDEHADATGAPSGAAGKAG